MKAIMSIARFAFLIATVGMSSLPGGAQAAPAQPSDSPAGPTNQEVHLLVGHSIVVRTDSRLKRVLVGNPAVLTTSTTAPGELVVTAIAPGASSLVLWQEDGQSRMIEAFADVDVTGLRGAVRRSMPNETVEIEGDEDKVLLTGTASSAATAEQIAKMASGFSKITVNSLQVAVPARQKEIMLKVRFAEVDRKRL